MPRYKLPHTDGATIWLAAGRSDLDLADEAPQSAAVAPRARRATTSAPKRAPAPHAAPKGPVKPKPAPKDKPHDE